MVDDDMDSEEFGKLISQGNSMVFKFAEDEDDEDGDGARYEYNAEISVFPPRLEDSIFVCKERAKEWSTGAMRYLGFLEARLKAESDLHRATSKSTRETIEQLSREGFRGDGIHYKGVVELLRNQELIAVRASDHLNELSKRVVEPLTTLRREHDNSRKRLWHHYDESRKKLKEAGEKVEPAKAKYEQKAHAWEKTLGEKIKEQASTYKVKLDKKTRDEGEAHQHSDNLEQVYRDTVKAANKALEEHKKGVQFILSAFERLLRTSDDKLKEYLALQAELDEAYYKTLVPQTADSKATLKKVDNVYNLQQFIARVSSGKTWSPQPFFTFEKYEFGKDFNGEPHFVVPFPLLFVPNHPSSYFPFSAEEAGTKTSAHQGLHTYQSLLPRHVFA